MKLKLKEGKVEATIKTTFGGVYFLEGEEQHLDDTKVLPEERTKILKDFDIIDPRGCEWAGGKKAKVPVDDNKAAIAEAKKLVASAQKEAEKLAGIAEKLVASTQKEAEKLAGIAEKATKKAKSKNTPENVQAAEEAQAEAEKAALAAEEAVQTLTDLEAEEAVQTLTDLEAEEAVQTLTDLEAAN